MAMKAETRRELEHRVTRAEAARVAAEERATFWAEMAAEDRREVKGLRAQLDDAMKAAQEIGETLAAAARAPQPTPQEKEATA